MTYYEIEQAMLSVKGVLSCSVLDCNNSDLAPGQVQVTIKTTPIKKNFPLTSYFFRRIARNLINIIPVTVMLIGDQKIHWRGEIININVEARHV